MPRFSMTSAMNRLMLAVFAAAIMSGQALAASSVDIAAGDAQLRQVLMAQQGKGTSKLPSTQGSAEQAQTEDGTPLSETKDSGLYANTGACDPQPFGQNLFSGTPQKSPGMMLSPKQRVSRGDRVQIAVWGAVNAEEAAVVDSQGFIYIKGVGPVYVEGKSEQELSGYIREEISRAFKSDVQVYAVLEQNAGTPVMVTGGVNRPGQYFGSAEDNAVVWLHRAGGINPLQGSYRDISVMRDGKKVGTIDLYPFLQYGRIDRFDWVGADVLVVGETGQQVAATGDVKRCAIFEFSKAGPANGSELIDLAQPMPGATHAIVSGHRNGQPYTQVYSLAGLRNAALKDGDKVRFYGAPQNEQVTVHVEGPTLGNRVLILPLNTKLSEALDMIPVDAKISNTDAVYLRRVSTAEAQQKALTEATQRLLQSVLTAPASSDGEALIRVQEAELVKAFALNAAAVKQEGRIVVMQGGSLRDLPLEDGDTIVIPQRTNVVSIEGEVMLPRTVVVKDGAVARDYVDMAGGFTERAMHGDFIVIHPNGDAQRGGSVKIAAGDRLLVLPRVDTKAMQTTKDIVQILYQVAVGAGVLLSINN